MLKTLLRKQMTEIFRTYFYDTRKSKPRSKASTIFLFVMFGVLMIGVLGTMFTLLSVFLCAPLTEAGLAWMYFTVMALLAILLGAFGSVFNTFAGLYLAKDNDLLLSMPIPVRYILAARLLGVYLLGLMYSGVLLLPAVIVYWCMASFSLQSVLGGILLTLPDELDEMTFDAGDNGLRAPRNIAQCTPRTAEMPLTDDVRQAAEARQYRENALPETIGRAAIYYAFDNTVNSSRFPYYSYMQGFWEGMGLRTTMNTRVTLSDLRRMNKYDLCILSAHGAYYTYSYGTFRKHTRTEPIILLTEASTLYKDIIYSFDLLAHRIIKLNGLYCVTADFFRNAYRSGQLSNTIIYSETCEFLGVTNSVDESMAEALLAGGARTVLGYVNNVYTVYSRSMLWDTVNHLAMGQTIGRALAHAKDTYGENDIIWYTEQGGRRPHAAAACLVLYGDENARLNVPENFSLEERAEAAEDMLADVLESAA